MNFIHIRHQFNLLTGFCVDIRIEQRRQRMIACAKVQKRFFTKSFDDIYCGLDDR